MAGVRGSAIEIGKDSRIRIHIGGNVETATTVKNITPGTTSECLTSGPMGPNRVI